MADTDLLPCPFCGKAMMLRGALWPSEGDRDGIIHAEPTDCPLYEFSNDTADESIIEVWNRRAPSPSPAPGVVELPLDEARAICKRLEYDASWDKCGHGYYRLKSVLASLSQPAKGERGTKLPSADGPMAAGGATIVERGTQTGEAASANLPTPANPAQVTDASEALDNLSPAESIGAFDGSGQWVEICTVADFRKLTAAIGAGGQAVAYPGQFAERVVAACRAYMNTYDVLADEVREHMQVGMADALRASDTIAHPVQPGWRDIASAPREYGHMILAPNRYGVVDTVCWSDAANDGEGGWDDGFYGDDLPPYDPEIWMPVPVLPAAPQPKGE